MSTNDENVLACQGASIAPVDAVRSPRRPSRSAYVREADHHVFVDAPDAEHFAYIDNALSGTAFTTKRAGSHGAGAEPRAADSGIAVVAVINEPTPHAPVLRAIDAWRRRGFTVVCYGAGAATWTLGAKSRLLIVGASHVLDTTHHEFARELRERLDQIASAAADGWREEQRIAEQMLAHGIVGSSPAITSLFRWIVRVSPVSSVPVLLTGETGTGKELAARAIHALDARRRGHPFIPVNCGAMNATLAESELFGHRRGAFTGADHDRRGLIRAANGGVLFLDEIGDLELGLQAKLLRVLQERQVLSLGEDHEVAVDVRIIAATNRDVEEMVGTGQFRADLFHRLSALSIRLPALRDRPEDIAPLVDYFVRRDMKALNLARVAASPEFVEALRCVRMPGNVRQLENVVHAAMVCPGRGEILRLRDLPLEIWSELADRDARGSAEHGGVARTDAPSRSINAAAALEAANWRLERALDMCEEEMVAAALGASNGNRSRAARMLGISPRTFFNKMRKHRLTA